MMAFFASGRLRAAARAGVLSFGAAVLAALAGCRGGAEPAASSAPRFATDGFQLVHVGVAQVQSFRAPADRLERIRVRGARTLAVPQDGLRVELREAGRTGGPALAVALIDSESSGLTRYYKWLAADLEAESLRAGGEYELVFSSKAEATAPWLVNCFYRDAYPDGAQRELRDDDREPPSAGKACDIVFEATGGGETVTSVPKGLDLAARREQFGLGPDGSDLHVAGEKKTPTDFGSGLARTGEPFRRDDPTTSEAVCRLQPERVKLLFAGLDLERPGLEKVKTAVGNGDWPAACDALIDYHRRSDSGKWLRAGPVRPGAGRDAGADAILKDTFVLFARDGKFTVPRNADGALDWGCRGPIGDRQWTGVLSRHFWFGTLVSAWTKTGNPEYARGLDRAVRDWVLSNPCRADGPSAGRWVTIDAGLRMQESQWPRAFYAFQDAEGFSPAGRILMLDSVLEHATYLRRFHTKGSNWALMELYGLACVAACWPEFRDASDWLRHANECMAEAMKEQVYPDGSQTELTSGYHHLVVNQFETFARLVERAGRPVSRECLDSVARMRAYQVHTIRPDGTNPLNNDSGRLQIRGELVKAAERLGRPDWLYAVTNGARGEKPAGEPSRVFPWAGHAVMRSGWDADAQWAFFDFGPYGTNHQHRDKLHISVHAFGRDLLVDGGIDSYMSNDWSRHFRSSAAHNTVLVDGAGQGPYRDAADRPAEGWSIQPAFDFARGEFTGRYLGIDTRAVHRRAVVHLRGIGWLVFDRVEPDRPCRIETLWHFDPSCTIVAEGLEAVSTDDGKGNLRIVPAGGPQWKLELVKGRTEPSIQGWHASAYNEHTPCATAVYSARIGKSFIFAWLLLPGKGAVPAVKVEALSAPEGAARVRAALPGGRSVEVAVRLAGEAAVEFGGGLRLEGDCGVLGLGTKPLVAGGRILAVDGSVLAAETAK